MSAAARFFYANAGCSWNPITETKEQGRIRGARELAKAEEWAKQRISFEWSVDRDSDSSEFSSERPVWWLWQCIAKGEGETVLASLGGIDFGRDGEPWGDPYKRVVEAELALDAMLNA